MHNFYDLNVAFFFSKLGSSSLDVILRDVRSWWREQESNKSHIFGKKPSRKRRKLLNDSVNFMNFCFICSMKIGKDRKTLLTRRMMNLFCQTVFVSFLMASFFIFLSFWTFDLGRRIFSNEKWMKRKSFGVANSHESLMTNYQNKKKLDWD